MNGKIFSVLLVIISASLASCSKTDEMCESVQNTPRQTWVTYTHTVNVADAAIPHTIQYLTSSGLKTVYNHTGSFSVRVPVQKFDSAGATYTRAILSFKSQGSDAETAPVIHSAFKIVSDYGFVIAETSENNCAYTERTLNEVRPLSWYNTRIN